MAIMKPGGVALTIPPVNPLPPSLRPDGTRNPPPYAPACPGCEEDALRYERVYQDLLNARSEAARCYRVAKMLTDAARKAWPWPTYCRCAESWTRHPLKAMAEGRFEPARWWAHERANVFPAWQRLPLLYVFSANREALYVVSEVWYAPTRSWFKVQGEVSGGLWELRAFDAGLVEGLVRLARVA